ncbi:MAG: putative glycoside hydrolase [Patescibacteria group bacterium]
MNWTALLTALILLSRGISITPDPLPLIEVKRPPVEVKAIYISAEVAQSQRFAQLVELVDQSELNAMVINIKESSGVKFWDGLADLVINLHQKNIWLIARQVVFQDNDLATRESRLALKNTQGVLWQGRGGALWLDPAAYDVWEYNSQIAKQALALGFDEINLDYIRFPSDGDIKGIVYPVWDQRSSKEQVIADFAEWLVGDIKKTYPHAIISADIFAFTLVQDWDLTIGQRASLLAQYFDVLSPMIYPSHYRSGNFGLINPAQHPYQVVNKTLTSGQQILNNHKVLIRPWLQDFNIGAIYTADLVRQQISAVSDSGYHSGWMLWNPASKYTADALKPE